MNERKAGAHVWTALLKLFHLLCCRFTASALKCPQRVGGLLLLLEVLLLSLACTFILLCERSTAAALHFMHTEQSAKRQPPWIGHHNPYLIPGTFNWPVLLPGVIRGQMRNGNRVVWCECDSHCHVPLDLCHSKWREIAALNCLFLSIASIWGIFHAWNVVISLSKALQSSQLVLTGAEHQQTGRNWKLILAPAIITHIPSEPKVIEQRFRSA